MINNNIILRYTSTSNLNNEAIRLITNDSDLGETSLDKLVNYIDIDVEGSCYLSLFGNDVLIQEYDIAGDNELGERLFVSLNNRKPYHKIRIEIVSYDHEFCLNSIELDVNYARRKQ